MFQILTNIDDVTETNSDFSKIASPATCPHSSTKISSQTTLSKTSNPQPESASIICDISKEDPTFQILPEKNRLDVPSKQSTDQDVIVSCIGNEPEQSQVVPEEDQQDKSELQIVEPSSDPPQKSISEKIKTSTSKNDSSLSAATEDNASAFFKDSGTKNLERSDLRSDFDKAGTLYPTSGCEMDQEQSSFYQSSNLSATQAELNCNSNSVFMQCELSPSERSNLSETQFETQLELACVTKNSDTQCELIPEESSNLADLEGVENIPYVTQCDGLEPAKSSSLTKDELESLTNVTQGQVLELDKSTNSSKVPSDQIINNALELSSSSNLTKCQLTTDPKDIQSKDLLQDLPNLSICDSQITDSNPAPPDICLEQTLREEPSVLPEQSKDATDSKDNSAQSQFWDQSQLSTLNCQIFPVQYNQVTLLFIILNRIG